MNRKALNITVGILLVIIFGLWLFVFQVRRSEVALVTTFGAPTRIITNAGPYLKWPWPIQRVHTFDQRIQNLDLEDKLDEPQTADGKILLAMVYVGWQITDPGSFYPKFANRSVSDPDGASIAMAEKTLEGVVRSTKNAVIGRHAFSDFISTDPTQFKLDAIEAEMLAGVETAVKTNNYGIEIRFLGLKKLELPESSTAEVFKQMSSERAILVSQIQRDGETQAANIRTAANSYSESLKASADAEAKRIQGEAQAEVLRYYKVFDEKPELANYILELDALKASLGKNATLIFDSHTQPFNLLTSTNDAVRK
jgi:membrane protease subunit HflC